MDMKAAGISSEMKSTKRDLEMRKFQNEDANVLVCSDAATRGLNLNLDLVINFDAPTIFDRQFCPKVYSYRVSRTGRFGKHGVAVTIDSDCNSDIKGVLSRDFGVQMIAI